MITDHVFDTTFLVLTIALIAVYSYLTFDYLQFQKKRLAVISNSQLRRADFIKPSARYLGSKLSMNETSLNLFDNLELKLHIDKEKGLIEYKRLWRSKKLKTEQIEFLIFEYLNFFNVTIHQYGKSIWIVNILAKLKNRDAPVVLLELKDKMDNAWQRALEQPIDEDLYFEKGQELVRVLSFEINKPFKIGDEEKLKTSINNK